MPMEPTQDIFRQWCAAHKPLQAGHTITNWVVFREKLVRLEKVLYRIAEHKTALT